MLRTAGLEARLGLDLSDFQKGIRNASRALEPIQKRMQEVGRRMTTAITVPVTAAGYAVARMGGDFQYSMNRVQALTGSTGSQLEALSDQAKELGISTQFSASQAADAMGFLAMAGFDANQILGTMPATLDLAAASGMDLARTADVMSNIMQGYGLATEEAARASDVLTKAFTSSNTDLGQLAEAMKYAGPVAAGMGVEFEEAAAAIGLMGNAGIQGSMAGTGLRQALTQLAKPTGDTRRTIERLGLSVKDLSPTTNSLTEIIERLSEAGADTTDVLTIFGQRAGPAMQTLIDQGADAVRGLTEELRESAGVTKEVADVQMQGFRGAMLGLKSAVEGLGIAVAESGVLDFFEDMTRRATDLVRRIADMNPAILRTTAIVAGVAAAIGPVLLALGSMTTLLPVIKTGFLALTGPVGLTAAAIVGVGAAAYAMRDEIEAALSAVRPALNAFAGAWRGVHREVGAIWQLITTTVGDSLDNIADLFETFSSLVQGEWADMWTALLNIAKRQGEGIIGYTRGWLERSASMWKSFGDSAADGATAAWEWLGENPVQRAVHDFRTGGWRDLVQAAADLGRDVAEGLNTALERHAAMGIIRNVDMIGDAFSDQVRIAGELEDAVANIYRPMLLLSGIADDATVSIEGMGGGAEETSIHLSDLAAALMRVDRIAAAFSGRDPLKAMQDRARLMTSFLEDVYGGDIEIGGADTARIRSELDALNMVIGETLAARARMTEDPLMAENFLPGLDDVSVRLDGLTERLGIVHERTVSFGEAAAYILADDVSMAVGRVVEGVIMMEDGFRSLSDTLKSFGEMAQRIFARLIADITAAVAKAAALRGIATLFGIGTIGSFGSLLRGALGFGGARAMGGPVMSGQAYVVGERGPELFVPPSAGKIIPNHALGAVRSGPIDVRIRGEFVQRGGDLVATIDTVRRVQGY